MPVTHTAVYMLLRLLGIHNSVTLWCAVMSEHKVLLVSLAAARLAAACRALAALMFPFRYAHVYIPLLPAGLAEVLATPTPFLIGVHSSLKEEVSELLDVIVADLDVGSLHIPAGVNIPRPEGKLLSSLQEALALVLQPELRSADSAFAPPPPASSPPHMLDKEIRAVFMRTLAKLLQGYRHCLTIIRIHPSPVLTFHKMGFLGARGLSQCQFAVRLLDSMFFNGLVAERGPPWRATDIWDELVQNLPEQQRLESLNPELELQHLQDLAMQLHLNENPNPQAFQQRILRPPEGASSRIHQPPLPPLDAARVRDVMREVAQRSASNPKYVDDVPLSGYQQRILRPPEGASSRIHQPPLPPLDAARVRDVMREVAQRSASNPKYVDDVPLSGYQQRILRPPEGASSRIHQPPLPPLDAARVRDVMREVAQRSASNPKYVDDVPLSGYQQRILRPRRHPPASTSRRCRRSTPPASETSCYQQRILRPRRASSRIHQPPLPPLDAARVRDVMREVAQRSASNPKYVDDVPLSGYQQRILRPPEGASSRIHQPPLPPLDAARVRDVMREVAQRSASNPKYVDDVPLSGYQQRILRPRRASSRIHQPPLPPLDAARVRDVMREVAQRSASNPKYVDDVPLSGYQQRILRPPEGASSRIHQPPLPPLDAARVRDVMREVAQRSASNPKYVDDVPLSGYQQRILRPPEGASSRIHQPPLPPLDAARVRDVMREVAQRSASNPKYVDDVPLSGYQQRILRPPEGASSRIHQPPLPPLDAARVRDVMREVAQRSASNPKYVDDVPLSGYQQRILRPRRASSRIHQPPLPPLDAARVRDVMREVAQRSASNPKYVDDVPLSGYQQRILRPPEGASSRIHQPPLPPLDAARVRDVMREVAQRSASNPKLTALRPPQARIVPPAAPPSGASDYGHLLLTNSARRLEVLRSCIAAIFECRYADARKSLPGVVRALRAAGARAALVRDLAARLPSNKHLLQHHQFELVVRLMNCALQSATALDEHTIAAAMLPLATAYCRKLCTGVIQYAYMCIQEHPVWTSQQFWEAAFYQDVQRDIKALYLPNPSHHQRVPSPRDDEEYISLLKAQEPSALEIAAEQMRLWPSLSPEKQRELIASEESTLYSQAIHYANRMVYLLLPLEGAGRRADVRGEETDRQSNSITNSRLIASEESTLYSQAIHYANRMVYLLLPLEGAGRRADVRGEETDRQSNSITNSVAESDSVDAESGFEEADPGEAGNNVIKMVSRFVDKVCTEGGVTAEHVRCLHQMIPGVVHMHLETLDAVARESRRLPPVQKPRIVAPALVPGETVSVPALRAYLVCDGRSTALLPAEGALFLTNYRLVFKGTPTDPYACEQTVVRSFPLCSLTREKAVRTHYLPHLEQSLQEGLQLRSATFQLIKVALDEEVSSEAVEAFRKQVARLRHPEHVLLHFALAPRSQPPPKHSQPKHHTLKGFAKKTLLKTARRAGLKPKPSKRQKYVLPSADARSLTSPPLMSSLSADTLSCESLYTMEELELGGSETTESPAARTLERVRERVYARDWARLGLAQPPFRLAHANAVYTLCRRLVRTVERVRERVYARDWARLGLAQPPFRLAHANAVYTLCRSYPAVIPVPESFGDDSLRRISRCYRQGRLPVITWRHPRTHALLARSAAPHHKGVMGMLKASHQTPGNAQSGTETTSSLEQERYLATLVACTPASRGDLEDSSLSLDSLLLCCEDQQATHTPLLTKAAGTLGVLGRNSGGKGGASTSSRHFGRWGSLKDRRQASHLDLYAPRQRLSTADADSVCGEGTGRRAALYVVCEKGGAALSCAGAELVPAEYPDARATKHAFKKLMRAAVPSAPAAPDPPGFLRLIEESGWLWQLRQLFQLSGAVVDLLDIQGSSVLLSLEDGWDATTQISSLAQICLEPYYRTLEGFRILVEKEWLALGHKFQQRSNIGATPQQGFTPTFLMFLDAVHQLQKQFPLAFEFNEYYLRFVAYHAVSCRFRTFLLDNEAQRAELGITAADDRRADTNRMVYLYEAGGEAGAGSEEEGAGGSAGRAPSLGHSLFDYIDRHHQKSPIFYNFLYTPDLDNPVLRPVSSISALEVWQYYTSEELSHGAPYDLEVLAPAEPDRQPQRRVVTAGYDSIARSMPDSFSGLLERIRQLELELGHLPQKWRVRWDQLELPNTLELQRNSSMSSGVVRRATLAWHKRGTLEVLVRGRLAAAPPPPAPAHRWAPAPAAAPARCDHCQDLLWGPLKTGVRCVDCGAMCHERCAESWAPPCTKYKAPPPPDADQHRPPLSAGVSTLQSSSQQYYEQFSSNVAENRTHEGHLYKRGALLKGWKQRWFVLDSIKHQLRYYDAMEDSHCKGFIDLAEVITVTQAAPAPGPPKKCDDRSFFDLRTSRRTYNFCASDANAAQEWIEKLQACLQ
ncbi:myotubularin-related protein 5 [Helicoverpa armigera]|uniref:myotubularin-related protein 5 n=1 Tax=Helicoverpa armigera TaxID=29058 RepID=UPI003082D0B0